MMTPEEIDKIVTGYKFPFKAEGFKNGITITDSTGKIAIELPHTIPRHKLLAKFIVEKLNHLST